MEVIIKYIMLRVIRVKILDKSRHRSQYSVDRRVEDRRYAIPNEQALCARPPGAEPVYCSIHDKVGTYYTRSLQPALHLYKAAFSIGAHPYFVSHRAPTPLRSSHLFIPGTALRYFKHSAHITLKHPSTQ